MANKVVLELPKKPVEIALGTMNDFGSKSLKATVERALRKSGEKVHFVLAPHEAVDLHMAIARATLDHRVDENLGRETVLAIEGSLQRQVDPKWYVNLPYRVHFWEHVLVH